MPFLYETKISLENGVSLNHGDLASLAYHNIFDYPLTLSELLRWSVGSKSEIPIEARQIIKFQNGFYFYEERGGIVFKRLLRKRISTRKSQIAFKAAKALSLIPTVKLVAVTGALAMENVSDESDIDLLIVTQGGTLWTTRILSLGLLWLKRIPTRRFDDKFQKDKICLNMWLDEDNLAWRKDRNAYTAHEIAQIVPLVNKNLTYERFIWKNKWVKEYWPRALKVQKLNIKDQSHKSKFKKFYNFALSFCILIFEFLFMKVEKIAFRLQYWYMKGKITREVVTPTRAFFHPVDWGKVVLSRFKSN